MKTLSPTDDRIVLKLAAPKEKTAGGLFIPATAKGDRSSVEAAVIAVGPGKMLENGQRRPMNVWPNQVVVISKYVGIEVDLGEGPLLVVREEDLLGFVCDGAGVPSTICSSGTEATS